MTKYIFLCDVVNADGAGVISKDHGPIIPRGVSADLDPKSDNVKWLEDSLAIKQMGSDGGDPGNSILDKNADEAIALVGAGQHSQEQLEELLAYEQGHKKRKTVTEAISSQIAGMQAPPEGDQENKKE